MSRGSASEVRDDFVPAEHYLCPDFLRLERERMWPRVWQVACREEELPEVGSFVTYDIMDETITVVRSSQQEIKAFYNVCQHRGRRLTEGCGQMSRFYCRFHGWKYDLEGRIQEVLDREDWEGCPDFGDADLSLEPVQVGTWGGFVFINMDPQAEPLADYLAPVPRYLDPFELEKLRYRWYASVKIPCNWKVALGAFNEAYHAMATHPQVMHVYGDDVTRNRNFGRHSMFYYPPNPEYPLGAPSPRLGLPVPDDFRPKIVEYHQLMRNDINGFFSDRDAAAVRRLLTEVEPDVPPFEQLGKALEFQREAAIASGAGWPEITMEQMVEAGIDWHVFPNLVMLPYPDGALAYRSLPDARDPDICIFEVYALERFAPGAEPELERMILHGDDDWRSFKEVSPLLQQDFDNMGEVQRGMKSRGFSGSRTNPLQEATVSHFHRTICDYVYD